MAAEKQVWSCAKCGNRITVFIELSTPPTCHNHVGGKAIEMSHGELHKGLRKAKRGRPT